MIFIKHISKCSGPPPLYVLTSPYYRIISSAQGTSLVGGLGYLPPEKFQIWRLRKGIFSTFHEKCLRKIDLEYENGKQLQVTVIKIAESKENKSIKRLDVSGSTGPWGGGGGGGGSFDMVTSDNCYTLYSIPFPHKCTSQSKPRPPPSTPGYVGLW